MARMLAEVMGLSNVHGRLGFDALFHMPMTH